MLRAQPWSLTSTLTLSPSSYCDHRGDRILPGGGHTGHGHADVLEGRADGLREQRAVVDDQDANRGASLPVTGSSMRNVTLPRSDSTQILPP